MNCSHECVHDSTQLWYTIRHRTVLMIFTLILQTIITAQTPTIGRKEINLEWIQYLAWTSAVNQELADMFLEYRDDAMTWHFWFWLLMLLCLNHGQVVHICLAHHAIMITRHYAVRIIVHVELCATDNWSKHVRITKSFIQYMHVYLKLD